MKQKKNSLYDWFHDDITWCAEDKCENKNCERNQANRRQKSGLFTVSMLKGTDYCPLKEKAATE